MKVICLFTVLAVAVAVASCTNDGLPTTPLDDGGAITLDKAAQGDRSQWVPMHGWAWDNYEYEAGFVSCINDGQGENVIWIGSGQWYKKEVVTPSGNTNLNLMMLLYDDSRIIGMETGEVWRMTRVNSHFHMNTRHSDGHTLFVQPDAEWFVSEQSGDRLRVNWLAKAEYDESFEIVALDMKIQCAMQGPK